MKQTVTILEKKPESYLVGCDKSACSGCHNELFCRTKDNSFEVPAEKDIKLEKGDKAEIDMPENKTIVSILLSLGFPLLMFFPGYFLGRNFTPNEVILFVWGVGSMGIGFLLSYLFFRIFRKKFSPTFIRKAD